MRPSDLLVVDSDLFVLLAGAELLEELIEALGFSHQSARRLQPLPFMLKKGPLARRYSEEIRGKAEAACEKIAPLEDRPSMELFEQFNQVPEIDPGEALLFTTATEGDGNRIVTGDLRACRALAAAKHLGPIRDRLTGRVVCLEAALDLLHGRLGFGPLRRRLAPLRSVHQTLKVLFSAGLDTQEDIFLGALTSYLRAVRQDLGSLLHASPTS